MSLFLVFANLGAGKTTYLAKIAHEEMKRMKKGKSVYKHIVSNTPITGIIYDPEYRTKLRNGYVYKDTLLLIDEGGIEYNNRLMRMSPEEIKFYKLSRHYRTDVIITSQSYDDVDITLRRIYKGLILMNKILCFTLIRPIRKKVTINDEGEIVDEYKYKFPTTWRLMLRSLHYKKFDSWYQPEHKEINMASLEVIRMIEKQQREDMKLIEEKEGGFITI